jgi:hypothetical protein
MRIFDETKTIELTEYDLEKGYLREDVLETEIPEQLAVEEKFHYETIKEYPNGGKDVEKVIDIEGKPYIAAHTESEDIQVYIPYTEAELERMAAEREIAEIKAKLAKWDYKTSKHADGEYTDEEWNAIVAQRKAWRARMNELEARYELGGDTE